MTKEEFLSTLNEKLSNLPRKDTAERIKFYEEMIDDRMESGLSEAEAIADVGTVEEIYAQFLKETPLIHIIKNRVAPRRKLGSGKIAVIASTSIVWAPILFSLAVAAFAVVISLYAALWSLVVSVWAVFVSTATAAPAGAVLCLFNIFAGDFFTAFALLSLGMVSAGIAIFSFYGALYSTKGAVILTKKIICWIKNLFIR